MSRKKRGFGSIRKLPSGRYQARYTGPDGALHKAPSTFAAKIDAEAWLTDRRREIDRGLWNAADDAPEVPLFRVYADDWLRTRRVAGRPLKMVTRQHYRRILDNHLIPEFGNDRLDMIASERVRRWHADLLPDTPTMRAHVYALLRSILNSAIEADYLDSNPAKIRGAGAAKRASYTTPATPKELATIAEVIDPPALRLIVLLAGWCGFRFGELIELKRSDVKVTDGEPAMAVVSIKRAAVYDKDRRIYVSTSPKSDAGVRDVWAPPHIVGDILDHLDNYTGPKASDRLFRHPENGGYLTPQRLYRSYNAAREVAGRPDLRFHDLRHTGATRTAEAGGTLAELQARLGHSTVNAAMRYQHASAVRDQELAVRLSELAKE